MDKKKTYLVGFSIALVLFLAVNVLASATLRSARVDLTENGLYSLSEGTRNILAKLEEPVSLTFYYSEGVANDVPQVKTYGTRVRELLEEYKLLSKGMVTLTMVDPEPFSEAEDDAVAAGVAGIPVSGNEKIYLGLAGTNSTDDEAAIPFFDPSTEPLLEHDITKLIYGLANPERAAVGILTSLDLEGQPGNPMLGQQGTPPWAVLSQLQESFEVRMLGEHVRNVPEEIDVLLVIHPKQFTDMTKYAIDQFVLGGGRVMAFVDPWSQEDSPPNPNDRMAVMSYQRHSELDPLLEAWGLRLPDGRVAADRSRSTPVTVGGQGVDYVAYLSLDGENCNADEPVVSLLNRILMPTAGILEEVEDTELVVTPLITTSRDAMQIDRGQVQFEPNPLDLLRNFVPEDQEFMLAARVTGRSRTAFPGGRPNIPKDEEPPAEEVEGSGGMDPLHEEASAGDINVVVVADVDLLHERYWLQRQQLGPMFLGYRKTADNCDFVINCVDTLSGSDDLISIRGRMKFERPFSRVDEIRTAAEQNTLRRVQDLQDKINETERRLAELQGERAEESSLILSADQQVELEKLRDERLETRRELRAVQHEMRKEIENLGMFLKVVHIAAVPLLFSLGALAFGILRTKRREIA